MKTGTLPSQSQNKFSKKIRLRNISNYSNKRGLNWERAGTNEHQRGTAFPIEVIKFALKLFW
jgi:hypothetical protein